MTRKLVLSRRVGVPVVVLAVLVVATLVGAGVTGRLSLSGLGGAGSTPPAAYDKSGTGGGAEQPAAIPSTANDGSGTDRQIVYNGSISVRVDDLDKTGAAADALVASLGGRVESRARTSGDQVVCPYIDGKPYPVEGGSYYQCFTGSDALTVVYRIPAARFNDAVVGLEKLGVVLASNTSSSDVTGAVRDLDASLRNLQATETALLGIMQKATTVTDILAVQAQLTQVQGEIERTKAQLKDLKGQAAEGTLQVAFSLPAKPVETQSESWKLQDQVDAALAGLLAVGQMTATGLVWLGIVGLPVLVVLVVLAYVVARIWRIVRPTGTSSPGAPGSTPEA